MNGFSKMLLWLAGSSRRVAATASPAAINVNERIGLLVAVCIVVAFGGGMAWGQRFLSNTPLTMLACGLGWATIVAIVDQAVLASMDAVATHGLRYKAMLLMRVAFAALMGTIPAQELVYTLYKERVAYEAKKIELEDKAQARQKVNDLHDLPATEKLVSASVKRVEELNAMARTLPPDIRKKLERATRCGEELKTLRQKQHSLLADVSARGAAVEDIAQRVQKKKATCDTLNKDAWGAKKGYDDKIKGELTTALDQKHAVEERHHEAAASAAKEVNQHAALAEAGLASGGGRSIAMKRITEADPEAATMAWVVRLIILCLETLPFILKGTINNPLSESVRHAILKETSEFELANAHLRRFHEESLKAVKNSPEIADLARAAALQAAEQQVYVVDPMRNTFAACEAIIAQEEAFAALSQRALHGTAAQISDAYLAAVREAYRRLAELNMRRASGASAV